MKRAAVIGLTALLILAVPAWCATQAQAPPAPAPVPVQIPEISAEAAVVPAAASPFETPYAVMTPVFAVEAVPEHYRAAMTGVSWKKECPVPMDKLRRVKVGYIGYDGQVMQGELIVHQSVSEEIAEIFKELLAAGYPIKGVSVVDLYQGDDTLSMEADNTSAFNFRPVAGSTSLSKHSYGIAIDINPIENPYIKGNYISPLAGKAFADRTLILPGMIIPGDPCHAAFVSRGWVWGGNWKTMKDYQHFEKPLKLSDL